MQAILAKQWWKTPKLSFYKKLLSHLLTFLRLLWLVKLLPIGGHMMLVSYEIAQKTTNSYDEEHECRFLINVRRNKLLGYWAAELFGLQGIEKENYARSVVIADFEEPGDDDVLRKVFKDCQENCCPQSRQAIRSQMDKLMIMAKYDILSDQYSSDFNQELLMSFS